MSTSSKDTLSHTFSKALPAEILSQIFSFLAIKLEVEGRALRRPTYQTLFDLRLVCKSWSIAMIPIAFSTLRITNSHQAKGLLNDWNQIFSSYVHHDDSIRHFPVRQLEMMNLVDDQLLNEKDKKVGESDQVDLEKLKNSNGLITNKKVVSIDQTSELIRLFCKNLQTLKLNFYSSVNCSSPLVNAVRMAKSIKELIIESDTSIGSSNLADLLEATPNLEELRIGYTGVPSMKLSDSALKKLRSLEFIYEYSMSREEDEDEDEEDINPADESDLRGIVNICEKAGSKLKILECYATTHNGSGLLPVLKAVQNTLEGLFTGSMCHQWSGAPLSLEYPRLRVVSTCPWDSMHLYSPSLDAFEGWFCWPILLHARTLVFHIEYTLGSWLHFFKYARKEKLFKPSSTSREEGLFRNLPNLRQCLFRTRSDVRFPHPNPIRDRIIPKTFPEKKLPVSLIKDFEAYGIKCFAIDNLKPDEIMALDARLDNELGG
ncbi:hypothetical protein DFH28DRAFT_1219645 [Melampsora americana]|nr:hypothetical protein DFH28DRAFT_1219645 [Melampsora americana]